MKKEVTVTIECEICRSNATAKEVVAFSRFCHKCNKRENYYFCSDSCFDHFLEHARVKK